MKPTARILALPREIWVRSSAVVRLVIYLVGVDIFLYVLHRLSGIFGWTAVSGTLRPWLVSIAVICLILSLFVAVRWLRKKLMWRLRNRLIVTYVFIGVIPVLLLLAMAVVAGELMMGQFATFLATSDLQHRLETLDTANTTLANALAHRLRQGSEVSSLPSLPQSESFPLRQVTLWYKGKATVPAGAANSEKKPVPAMPGDNNARVLAEDDGLLYLRAVRTVPVGSENLTVISSVPLNEDLLHDITANLGHVVLARASSPGEKNRPENRQEMHVGEVPSGRNLLDWNVAFAAPVQVIDWHSGERVDAYLLVSTRIWSLLDRLFANLGSNAGAILAVLVIIAALLGVIELLALIIGVRLTRTMTRSVYELYNATRRINRGDFTHRISVRTNDQLAELETSFNSMSDSLERLIAEQKEKQRMESELAIAHEVQEQLFPLDLGDLNSLEVHGVCRPARSVSGDYYDFLPLGGEKLGLAVGDISGKGISAALLMANIHSAVRVYEMGRVPVRSQLMAAGASAVSLANDSVSLMPAGIVQSPASVLGLLNRHLFHSTPPEKYATMFFGLWNGNERVLKYSNAGHLPPFIVRQNGNIEELTVGGTVIGLFDEAGYEETSVQFSPGDLFVAYSDGLTEPENEFGEFGSARLIELIRSNRTLPLARISEVVTTSVLDWIGAAEQPDDVTLVLARAR